MTRRNRDFRLDKRSVSTPVLNELHAEWRDTYIADGRPAAPPSPFSSPSVVRLISMMLATLRVRPSNIAPLGSVRLDSVTIGRPSSVPERFAALCDLPIAASLYLSVVIELVARRHRVVAAAGGVSTPVCRVRRFQQLTGGS